MKILILDDEAMLVELTSNLIRQMKHIPVEAVTAEEAIAKYQAERPDFCILDIYLEGSAMDGLKVLEKIKKIDKDAVGIMMTRLTDEESIDRARQLGAFNYVFKPLTSKEIKAMVNQTEKYLMERKNG
ncbi:MAG: response regulator [Candidatus Omnitrophica bacterium]|nr:response regulator [Candidatus Omnitrophota bacterium]